MNFLLFQFHKYIWWAVVGKDRRSKSTLCGFGVFSTELNYHSNFASESQLAREAPRGRQGIWVVRVKIRQNPSRNHFSILVWHSLNADITKCVHQLKSKSLKIIITAKQCSNRRCPQRSHPTIPLIAWRHFCLFTWDMEISRTINISGVT